MMLWNQAILEIACKTTQLDELDFYLWWMECLWSQKMWEHNS
jgi:hypothetical protein